MNRIFIVLLALAACDKSPQDPLTNPDILLISGFSQTDTIDAILAEPLIVEVRDARNRVAAGVTVHFENANVAAVDRSQLLFYDVSGQLTPSLQIQTDQAGRAQVRVRLGISSPGFNPAGNGVLRVSVPTLNARDSATFTIRPGNAVDTYLSAPGTVIVGTAFTPSVYGLDRRGHITSAAYSIVSSSQNLAVVGDSLRGVQSGFGSALVRTAIKDHSFEIAVLPNDVVAGRAFEYPNSKLVVANLAGTILRRFADGDSPDWNSAGSEIVFVRAAQLLISDTLGNERTVLPEVSGISAPRWAVTGDIIFMIAGNVHVIWSVAADGGNMRSIVVDSSATLRSPDPSPDGLAVAYNRGSQIVVRDLRSGSERVLVTGLMPRWSPDGNWIAYGESVTLPNNHPSYGIRTVSISGAPGINAAPVLAPGEFHPVYHDWTSDGRYVVVSQSLPPVPMTGFSTFGRWTFIDPANGKRATRGLSPNIQPISVRPAR